MFRRLIPAGGVLGGLAVGYMFGRQTDTVSSSWTTTHTPSVPWDWDWDKRDPSSLQKPDRKPSKQLIDLSNKAPDGSYESSPANSTDDVKLDALKSRATRHIILVRHGQYNLEGSADKDRILTKLGEEQARLTGERLKALQLPITRMVHSTMARATQTANIMLTAMNPISEVESSDLIREGGPVAPEPPIGHWRPERHFFADGPRIEAGFRDIFHRASPSQKEDSYEVIVCHANVIRYMVCRGLQFPGEAWLRISLHNGSLTYLTIRPDGRVALRQLGECGHMPPDTLSLT